MLPVAELLFFAAVAGHLLIGLRLYNWCYGGIVNEHVSDAVRHALSVVIAALPVAYWWFFGLDGTAPFRSAAACPLCLLVAVYMAACCATIAALPLLLMLYWRRRPCPVVASNHTRPVDVAAQLGSQPLGRGRHSWMARLPGNEIFQVDLVEKTLELPRLPAAWDGLTILHLSDLHFCGVPDRAYFRRVVELCNEWRPDLVALTGDVVDSEWHHRWVVPVLGRLRWSVAAFAILGNHDYRHDVEKTRRRLRRIGLRVLENGGETLEVRGEPLVVIGHEGPWLAPPPDLRGVPEGPFRLCLSHTPDNIAWARRHRIDLMLAGHVHGGQIRLPLVGSVFVPSVYGRRYDCGTFLEPPTLLHVSRGLGGEHPVRYNCRPEATLLRLHRTPDVTPGHQTTSAATKPSWR
jgi:predicted MPP superfamily phosphohydrolase